MSFLSYACGANAIPLDRRARFEALMSDLREAVLIAGDRAARLEMDRGDDAAEGERQHAVVVLDPLDQAAREILDSGVRHGKVPPQALGSTGVVIVVDLSAARSLVAASAPSGDEVGRLDEHASFARLTGGMLLIAFTCGSAMVGCMARASETRGSA